MNQAEIICTLLIVVAALAILAKKVALPDAGGGKWFAWQGQSSGEWNEFLINDRFYQTNLKNSSHGSYSNPF